MQKVLDNHRRFGSQNNLIEEQLVQELTPNDSHSSRIWNAKGYKGDQHLFDENRLIGKVGSYQFTSDQQRTVEERFKDSVIKRRRHILDNALRASQIAAPTLAFAEDYH